MKRSAPLKRRKDLVAGKSFFEKYELILIRCGLFLSAFLVYGWTGRFDYGLDDLLSIAPVYKTDTSLAGLADIWEKWYAGRDYRPVTLFSFWLQRWLFGHIDAGTSHLVNVLLFGALLILIHRFILVSRFVADDTACKVLALLTALVFLVHPNHVSVVANIKSRDNILSMLFGVASTIQFLLAYDRKQWWRIGGGLVWLLFAMFSKVDAYAFILAPVLVIVLFRIDLRLNAKVVRQLVLLLVFVIIVYQLVFGIREHLMDRLPDSIELSQDLDPISNPLIGRFTLENRISMMLTTLMYYAKFLMVPWGYYYYFGGNQIPLLPLFSLLNLASLTIYALLGGYSAYLYFSGKNKVYLFGFLFFLMSIFYASNFGVIVSGIVMDRYNFIPSLGFCIALSMVMINLLQQPSYAILREKWLLLLLVVYTGFTVYRTSAWRNNLTLFTRDIQYLDKSFHANKILGSLYINMALDEIESKNPDKKRADSLMELGRSYIVKANSIYDRSPSIWVSFGFYELYHGNNAGAAACFSRSIQMDSNYVQAYNKLGVAYRNLQQPDSAIYCFRLSVNKEREYGLAAQNLIDMLAAQGKKQELDSLLNALEQRFPNNPQLREKIKQVRTSQGSHF